MKNNDYPIYFKNMQVMMVCSGSGMEIWNVVNKK